MNWKKIKETSIILLEACFLAAVVLISLAPVSCKVTAEGIKILDGDYSPPVLQSFSVIDSNTLELLFSEEVTLSACVVSPYLENVSDSEECSASEELSEALAAASGAYGSISVDVNYEADYSAVLLSLKENMETGKKYELYGNVKDSIGNSLTFCIPFIGYNGRIPGLLMTEIQSETVSGQKKLEKENGTYRTEFIEFLVLSDGNLAGLEICSAYDGSEKSFALPPLEVKCGEIFVVHFRNKGNGCVNEKDDNLALAFGIYTNPDVRDLWSEQTETALGNKTDVILVRNIADGKVIDAFFYVAEGIEEWPKGMGDFAEAAVDFGIYDSAGVEEAFVTSDLSASRTIARKNAAEILEKINSGSEIEFPVKNSSSDWAILKEATPGHL